jgi:two-component system sensor histidine kinase KdpD
MRPALESARGYLIAVLAMSAVAGALKFFSTRINPTTAALALLLVVLYIATRFGSRPAVLAAMAGVLCFNFFFLPPIGTLAIAEPENWVALAAFLITAVTVGELSARARRRTEEAEAGRREIERLYSELRDAFERTSEAEALRRSERLKSALLDAVTHDIRTPLTSIKASVTTLLDELQTERETATLDSEGRREMLEVINEEADRLNRFIESLLELARLESGKFELRLRLGPIDEMLRAALDRAKPLTRGHTLEISIGPELPPVRVDAKAVAEVVYTLVDNAAKYSPAGSNIKVAADRLGDEMLRLSVEDEGPGIPAELRERVFDKFFRAGRTTQSPVGTGLGLAIARGIVDAHGGRIWIEDTGTGRGVRVVVTLPLSGEEKSRDAQLANAGSGGPD